MAGAALLTDHEAAAYWQDRHARESPWRSGGDLGLNNAENRAFYLQRLGSLTRLMPPGVDESAPRSLLDAGCGRGYIAQQLSECGWMVTGTDRSLNALTDARTRVAGVEFILADLATMSLRPFNMVICVDVLFHLTQDDCWEAAVRNLVRHVSTFGSLVFTERWASHARTSGSYIKHRDRGQYAAVLEEEGMRFVRTLSYERFDNDLSFVHYERVLV